MTDKDLVQNAISIVEIIGDSQVVDALIRLFSTTDNKDIRKSTAEALAKLKPKSALSTLTELLNSPDLNLVQYVIYIIAAVRNRQSIDILIEYFDTIYLEETHKNIILYLIEVLSLLQDGRMIIPLIHLLKKENANL